MSGEIQIFKEKINLVRVAALSTSMIAIALFIFFDYQKVNRDCIEMKVFLSNIRFETLEKNRPLIAKFKEKEIIVSDYESGETVRSMRFLTLHKVNYDTKLGKNMIVFMNGVTNPFNIRIHGGDLSLKSWLGFEKFIHVNCAGYVREGRYPELL